MQRAAKRARAPDAGAGQGAASVANDIPLAPAQFHAPPHPAIAANGHDGVRHGFEALCEPGIARRFGLADLGTTGMVGGWAQPEDGHTWNNGKEAALGVATAIPTRAPLPRLMLEITGRPYITQLRPAQEMTVYGNGFRLGYRRMAAHDDVLVSILLLPQWWFVEGGHATLHLVFHLPLSIRPRDVGDSEDGRELAFAFQTICLRPCEV